VDRRQKDIYSDIVSPPADYMAELGEARRLPTNLDVLASDVHCKLEFYKNAYMDFVGINNVLHGVVEEKGKLQQEQNGKYSLCFSRILIVIHHMI
jgi:hypothetical protein